MIQMNFYFILFTNSEIHFFGCTVLYVLTHIDSLTILQKNADEFQQPKEFPQAATCIRALLTPKLWQTLICSIPF